ncbi:MAG: hypothetical protein KF873_06360 [Gemmataceae bacterium]|nr:hypothetical protein [Gemmataceae bacterium]
MADSDKATEKGIDSKKSSEHNKPKKKPNKTANAAPWTFPKNILEDAISIPKAIEEKNAGNPMPADQLVKAVGYNKPTDWRFLDLLRSANLYGLVTGTGQNATVSIAKIGQDVVAPGSSQERQKALLEAFRNVEDFKKVDDFYGNKRIPEDEYFLNTLTRQFGIQRDRASTFAEIFRANISFLKSFNINTGASANVTLGDLTVASTANADATASTKEKRVREFLDTCFVMMPFGGWFDRYYQEIYVQAIKDTGLEPVRADELFSTGSVMEQIWEQITRSKVLLADLTDKNPNVFYELGLAHAASKPVVFTSARIDDVPFDLRHLRVIVYETREPEWAPKLRKHITEYLRNTIKDPNKSIPHPFRVPVVNNTTPEISNDG